MHFANQIPTFQDDDIARDDSYDDIESLDFRKITENARTTLRYQAQLDTVLDRTVAV